MDAPHLGSPLALPPALYAAPALSPRPPPPAAATSELRDRGRRSYRKSLQGGGEGVPESPRSGAVALGRQQWGPWSPGGRRGSGGGPVPGRGGVRRGAQGGQARGGALGFQPGWEEEEEEARRRGRGRGGAGGGARRPRAPGPCSPRSSTRWEGGAGGGCSPCVRSRAPRSRRGWAPQRPAARGPSPAAAPTLHFSRLGRPGPCGASEGLLSPTRAPLRSWLEHPNLPLRPTTPLGTNLLNRGPPVRPGTVRLALEPAPQPGAQRAGGGSGEVAGAAAAASTSLAGR